MIKWQYEVEGFHLESGLYLPDFFLPHYNLWVEIKGITPTFEEEYILEELVFATGKAGVMFTGLPCENPCYVVYFAVAGGQAGVLENPAILGSDMNGDLLFGFNREGVDEFWMDGELTTPFPVTGSTNRQGLACDNSGYMPDWFQRAINASKSARFEHGQKGAFV